MNRKVTLTITSLLSVVCFAVHWIDEIARGLEPRTLAGIGGVVILVVWSYATLVLGERRWPYIVTLLGGVLGAGVLVIHMKGAGLVGGRIANTSGVFFWALTLITLGVTSALSVIFSARGLWSLRRGPS